MRYLIALALASCSPAAPQAPRTGVHLSELTYHCSPDGYIYARFTLPDGVEEGITGERCDYEQWARDEAEHGPVRTMQRLPDYEEWLRVNRPEA